MAATIEQVRQGSVTLAPTAYGDPQSVVLQAEAFEGNRDRAAMFNGHTFRAGYTPKRSGVVLGKDWAEALGVPRNGAVYRLSKRELRHRLSAALSRPQV